ncbi:hypothetical protein PR048_018025 [Dryococelus australis]|uniref:BED-type domain-containing protein n=1 Tax=Dryococelus australis TaxID=614101 RepID=A0ABQ9HBQ4_9NEOP|nr:hypothetical protein PR048_018025 [Dryococelus australis]
MTEVKSHKRKCSLVWQHFEEGEGYAKCLQCLVHLKTPIEATTALKNHLSCHHLAQYQDFLMQSNERFVAVKPFSPCASSSSEKQQTFSSLFKEKESLPPQGKEAKIINTKIAKIVHYLKQRYKIPLQQMLKHELIETASQHNNVYVAMTTDTWTSIAGYTYMSLTCHYLHEFE